MEIYINDIDLNYEQFSVFGESVIDRRYTHATVNYTVAFGHDELKGEVEIPFAEYKVMSHNDVVNYIKKYVNKQFVKRP